MRLTGDHVTELEVSESKETSKIMQALFPAYVLGFGFYCLWVFAVLHGSAAYFFSSIDESTARSIMFWAMIGSLLLLSFGRVNRRFDHQGVVLNRISFVSMMPMAVVVGLRQVLVPMSFMVIEVAWFFVGVGLAFGIIAWAIQIRELTLRLGLLCTSLAPALAAVASSLLLSLNESVCFMLSCMFFLVGCIIFEILSRNWSFGAEGVDDEPSPGKSQSTVVTPIGTSSDSPSGVSRGLSNKPYYRVFGPAFACITIVFGYGIYLLTYSDLFGSHPYLVNLGLMLGCGVLFIATMASRRWSLDARVLFFATPLVVLLLMVSMYASASTQLVCGAFLIAIASFISFCYLDNLMVAQHGSSDDPRLSFARGNLYFWGGAAMGWVMGMISALVLPGIMAAALVSTVVIIASLSGYRVFKHRMGTVDPYASSKKAMWKLACQKVCTTYDLTPRESEVLFLLARGRNAVYIKDVLTISEPTAKTHIHHIYQKTEVTSQQELLNLIESIDLGDD